MAKNYDKEQLLADHRDSNDLYRNVFYAIEKSSELVKGSNISMAEANNLALNIMMFNPAFANNIKSLMDKYGISKIDAFAVTESVSKKIHGKKDKLKGSSGERAISDYLVRNNILFESEKTFSSLKHKSNLRIDFYIKHRKLAIEFNGMQHYKPVSIFGGDKGFSDIVMRDNIKAAWCEENGINLKIIRYDDNINDKLSEILGINDNGN